jgi:hypothetical protein
VARRRCLPVARLHCIRLLPPSSSCLPPVFLAFCKRAVTPTRRRSADVLSRRQGVSGREPAQTQV